MSNAINVAVSHHRIAHSQSCAISSHTARAKFGVKDVRVCEAHALLDIIGIILSDDDGNSPEPK